MSLAGQWDAVNRSHTVQHRNFKHIPNNKNHISPVSSFYREDENRQPNNEELLARSRVSIKCMAFPAKNTRSQHYS